MFAQAGQQSVGTSLSMGRRLATVTRDTGLFVLPEFVFYISATFAFRT
jgi:hypothetical protein